MITAMLPAAFNRTAGFLFGQPLLTLVREALGTGVCSTGPYVVMCVLVCFFVAVPEAAYHGWGRKDSVQRHDEDVGVPACAWRVAWPRHGAAVRGIGSSSNQFLVAGACACAGDCRAALIRVYLGQQYPLSAYPTLWLIGITFMVVVTGGMLQVRVLTGVAVSSLSCLIVNVCARTSQLRELLHPRILHVVIKPYDANHSFLRTVFEESMWQLAKRLVRVCMRELMRTHGHNSHLRTHTHTHSCFRSGCSARSPWRRWCRRCGYWQSMTSCRSFKRLPRCTPTTPGL